MGVYYHCSKCDSTLHLTPQSVGFGKLRIPCVVCDGEAMYMPSGPSPGAKVIQVPAKGQGGAGARSGAPSASLSGAPKRNSKLSLSAMISSSSDNSGPNLTVPLQTPQALLDMDAAEAAPTLPVTGLTDEQIKIFKGGAASSSARAQSSVKSLRPKGGGAQDFIDATTPMESPVDLLNAAYDRAVGRASSPQSKTNSTVEQPGLEAEIIQRATANAAPSLSALTDLPHDLRHGGPESSDEALTMHIERPTPAPVRRIEPKPQAAPARQGPDEDKIPTRSLEGLADREVRGYARELYTDADALEVSAAEPQTLPPFEGEPSLSEESNPSWGLGESARHDDSFMMAADTSVAPPGGPHMTAPPTAVAGGASSDGFSMGDLSSPRAGGPGGGVGGVPVSASSYEPELGGGDFGAPLKSAGGEPAWGRPTPADEEPVGQRAAAVGEGPWSMHGEGRPAASPVASSGAPRPASDASSRGASGPHTTGPATGFGPSVGPASLASSSSSEESRVNGHGPSQGIDVGQGAGEGPSMGGGEQVRGLDGLGADGFSDERPSPQGRSRRRDLGLLMLFGVGVFCVVAFVVAFLAYQAVVLRGDSPSSPEVSAGGQAPPATEPSRAERFGFAPVDEGAPFEVEGVRFKLKSRKGDNVSIWVEGTLFNQGENALDTARLTAVVGVVREDGEVLKHSLGEATFEPRVARRRAWQPGQSVSFELQASEVPRADVMDSALDRFMWLTLEAKNGKSYAYEGTLVEVDIE